MNSVTKRDVDDGQQQALDLELAGGRDADYQREDHHNGQVLDDEHTGDDLARALLVCFAVE